MQQLGLLTNKTREEESIEFIQKHEPKEGWFGGFSGGKDSTVMKALVEKAGVRCDWYYSDTGIDPPEVVKFIREYHPDVKFRKPFMDRKRKHPNWKGTRSFYGML